MPIHFYCQGCRQLLKAKDEKVARKMPCPKCKATVTVPAQDDPEYTRSRAAGKDAAATDPFAEMVVYDDEIVYDTGDEEDAPRAPTAAEFDRHLVAVSRPVLYGHAVLLAALAIVAFAGGYLVGHSGPPAEQVDVDAPRRVMIDGRLMWEATTGMLADKGAVVIALPEGFQPESKLPGETLGPDKPMPGKDDQVIQTIEQWGGDYARTNDAGEFELFLLPGAYQLLLISRQSERLSGVEPDRDHLAALGSFFTSPHELIGPFNYRWTTKQLDESSRLLFEFAASDK